MENNYGRSKNFQEEGQDPVITSNQTGHSRMSDLLHPNEGYENGWVKHPDEEEVQFVTKAINELDPEILAAMEHLSITDEDLMPSAAANQNDRQSTSGNWYFHYLFLFICLTYDIFWIQVKSKVRGQKVIKIRFYLLKILNSQNGLLKKL